MDEGRGPDAGSGLPPEVIAEEIVRAPQAALNEFTAIARSLGGEIDVPEAEVEVDSSGNEGRVAARVRPSSAEGVHA